MFTCYMFLRPLGSEENTITECRAHYLYRVGDTHEKDIVPIPAIWMKTKDDYIVLIQFWKDEDRNVAYQAIRQTPDTKLHIELINGVLWIWRDGVDHQEDVRVYMAANTCEKFPEDQRDFLQFLEC